MKSICIITPLLGSIALLVPAANAADIIKNNAAATNALNTAAAWTGGIIPGPADIAVWDLTSLTAGALATQPQLGGDLSWLGIRIANPPGTANAATTFIGIQNTSSANTLTLGDGGIDMSAATASLRIDSRILIGASQTWNIANSNTSTNPQGFNNGEDLGFQAAAAAAPFNLGGNTVTVNGAGAVTITSGYTLSNGTFNINNPYFVVQGGGNRVTTINADVSFNVATGTVLHFQSNSGAAGVSLTSNGTVNLNGGTLRLATNSATLANNVNGVVNVNSASTLNIGKPLTNNGAAGTINFNANLAGSGALSFVNDVGTAPLLVTIGGNNSGYTGAITFTGTAGRVMRMTTTTAGSANATWTIGTGQTLALNAVNVDFGTLNGTGTINTSAAGTSIASVGAGAFSGVLANGTGTLALTKVGAGTLTLGGANTYTGATLVNGGTLLTSPAHTGATNITVADGATFGVNLASAGTTFTTPSLTSATTNGGALQFNLGTLGNTTAPVINAASFNPVSGTLFKITGSNFTLGTPFPLLSYSGAIGGGGFGALSLALPFRVSGNLVDNSGNTRVDLNITGAAVPAWRGTLTNNWDIDNVGDGSAGTANWLAGSGPNTYVQAAVGTDSVLFDDTVGAGPTNVNLAATVSPNSVSVNNSAVNYTFSGAGKINGVTGLTKSGNGTLTLANTIANDYSGGTTINAGTLTLGDGVTAGAGIVAGAIANNGTLVLNRPDNHALANIITGTGILRKEQANTINVPAAATYGGPVELNGGTVRFDAGGNLSGPVSGGGALTSNGGTLQLSGAAANTNTSLTTISAGILELNKPAGTNAVGGDITITGAGQLSLLAGDQLPDTATITLLGSNANSVASGTLPAETVANVIVNSSVAGAGGGQVIMRNNMVVTGTGTLNSGILGVASGHNATVNAINITSAPGSNGILRIAGSGGPSTLNIGLGGITASGGEIQVKFNTNEQPATLNLGGDFTATGNVAITNAGYTGVNLNVINLIGTRTFDIAAGTTTTVTPDIAGSGDLIKTGDGTLSIEASSTLGHAGSTTVAGGTLIVKSALNSSIAVQNGAILDISQIPGGYTLGSGEVFAGNGTIAGNAAMAAGAQLAPGESVGTLTFGSNLDLSGAVTPVASGALLYELGTPFASDLTIVNGTLNIGSGDLEFDDLVFTILGGFTNNSTYTLFDGDTPIAGSLGPAADGFVGGLPAHIEIADGGNDLVLVVPEPGSAALLLGGLALLASRRRRK